MISSDEINKTNKEEVAEEGSDDVSIQEREKEKEQEQEQEKPLEREQEQVDDTSVPPKESDTIVELQLGDIIKIENPINEHLNDQIFIIDYIDKSKAFLINTDTFERVKLNINSEGIIGDGNIKQIAILSRSESPSYSVQNGLTTGKWLNIYFGGTVPVIITGEITNVENDMIEIRTVDDDIIYINFDYKGIPEDLPIEKIEIREKPERPLTESEKGRNERTEEGANEEGANEEADEFVLPDLESERIVQPPIQLAVPITSVKNQIREFIVKADQIRFGDEELGAIVQYVDVTTSAQRYSLETQVADLLDELLSTIPNAKRTPRVLNNIHLMIERFKQLRERFSTFDQYGNISGSIKKNASYKPLAQYFEEFKHNLYWILPVVKNIKKVYDVKEVDEDNNDVVEIELAQSLSTMKELIDNYRSNTMPTETSKYSTLYSELNPFFTPFDLIGDESAGSTIGEKFVNDDINVIIDNLEDMYSSVFSNNMIRNKRFLIQKYNIGVKKLDTIDSTSSKLVTVRVPVTTNDLMSVSSFVTLPEPTIHFSKINLPGTSLLEKANLNQTFLNYWQLLKKKTTVSQTIISNLGTEIEFNEVNFANNIKNYVLNLTDDDLKGLSKGEVYSKFIDIIIPKTKILFNMMKKYITGRLSIVDVVSYLEPFLVYSDDLTYNQYGEIVRFIDEKISEYNRTMVERSREFRMIMAVTSNQKVYSRAYSVIDIISKNLRADVIEDGYDIHDPEVFTNSEILKKITIKDCGRLYTTAISLQSAPLMFPSEFSSLFTDEKTKLDKKLKEEDASDKCSTITLAKYYDSKEALENDNGKQIYFDKKYDKTNYSLLDNYEKEIIRMSPEELLQYVIRDLMKKQSLSESDADYLANTLLDGHKRVIDGQFAILYKGYQPNTYDEIEYYVRKGDSWQLDEELSKKDINTDESSILCDLQKQCMNVPSIGKSGIDDKCESIEVNELGLQSTVLSDVINEFDLKYKVSKDKFEKDMKDRYEYLLSIIAITMKLETYAMLKYNNQKYNLGINTEDDKSVRPVSPYSKLLSLIMGQTDFVKQQTDIIKFVAAYTRPALTGFGPLNELESEHWLYCIKTNVPLLPTFKYDLASAFVVDGPSKYAYHLDLIISKIGKISDDGDWWVDENSGEAICHRSFSTEEGYEEGFRLSTRAIMEADAGNKIMASSSGRSIKYDTPDTIMINNVVMALSTAMGINIDNQKEFIINGVLTSLRDSMESESEYKQKVRELAEKGKKIASYKDFYNTALLYYTMAMYLIAVQTSIPSIKTRRTHPGCVRSFSGYPFEGTGDYSSLIYLSCVAYDIRQSAEPWNVLKSQKGGSDKIQNKIKDVINTVLLSLPEVKRRFEEKTDYLLTETAAEIPEEHDISKWLQFLPPLVPFKITNLNNISDEFKRALISDIRSGSDKQLDRLLVVESKIIKFSLAIQEKIQDIVKKRSVLLRTSSNEPYLENSCCESQDGETTFSYFANIDPKIAEYNDIVQRLSNLIDDVNSYSKSGMFCSAINTKNVYPEIINQFDEKTIYLAFIYFCKFKSLVPIPDDLISICTSKPGQELIDINDSLDRIIQKLKEDGRNYSMAQFLRLIQLIARNNIVDIQLDTPLISSITRLKGLLGSIDEENDEVVERSLRDLINLALDTFDIATEETTKEVKSLNNFLSKNIDSMKDDIIDFIQKNSGPSVTRSSIRKTVDTIKNLSNWAADSSTRNRETKISDDAMYNSINFYKTYIENFVTVFPSIILNKVDYNDIHIPNYYGFSASHAGKLKKYISSYFEKLKGFYGIPTLTNILETIKRSSNNLLLLSKETPAFTSIRADSDKHIKPVFDQRTSRYLFEYYLLRVIINYLDLSDDEDMVVTEIKKEVELTDIFSVDYVEETETLVDLTLSSRTSIDTRLLTGNKKELRQSLTQLLVAFFSILNNEKETIDTSYEEIQDRVFKLREREKDMVTDRLKNMTDEERDADTILKINKLGMYSKGLQKGLVTLDKDFYDEEQQLRDEMVLAERKIRKKNKGVTEENLEFLLDDYLEETRRGAEIDEEANDMGYMDEDFFNGNTDGNDAPEHELGEDYEDS